MIHNNLVSEWVESYYDVKTIVLPIVVTANIECPICKKKIGVSVNQLISFDISPNIFTKGAVRRQIGTLKTNKYLYLKYHGPG